MIDQQDYRLIVDAMPITCVDLVLRNGEGKYLLVRRANEPLKGQWWIPGGRVIKGETLEQAAVRKAREELGLELSSLTPLGYYERHWKESPFGLDSGTHTVSFVFSGIVAGGTVSLDEQSSDWEWFPELPAGLRVVPFGGLESPTTFPSIAKAVERHMAALHAPQPFVPGKTRIPLNVPTYGSEEVMEALDSLMSTWVTMGKKVKRFEEMWAEYIGKWMGVMTNSGSSANLLALSCLGLKPGDEVITPALTWATTVFPIAQVGAVPVLVDVDRETYNIRPEAVEAAVNSMTRAIMPVHLLGNPCDMDALMDIARRHGLYVIEDACEAHGAEYKGRKVGSFGDLSTFSFFFSHHISTIEGGMVLTSNSIWADQCRARRAHGWIREIPTKAVIASEHPSIDPRFLFLHTGYNFRPTEIAGAFGIHQLPRLEGLVEHRRAVAAYFNEALAPYQDWLQLPSEASNTRHSYFAYPLTVREGAPFTKAQLAGYLESRGLETRPIESGNMAVQPAMKEINYRAGDLTNAQYIHDNGFFFGNHQGIGPEQREAIVSYFQEFFGRF